MKRNGIELLKMILSVILFAGAVLFIGFQVSQNRKIAEDARIKQESRLDIAVVNEDQGGQLEGQPYDIGESYIKHLEKDTSNNWTVVPRNLAEDGLESGKYQLVVYIPSNFSKKVVDINSVTPEKATVTYKVNAKGNATVENMANQVGNRIVTDLDQQLVGVFMASILDNLYQAQQNVKTVVDTQGVNIGTYQDSILGVATNFRNSLPNLLDAARLSGGTNDQLISSLTNSTELFDNLETGEGEYSNSLRELMEQRAAGDISYGKFVENLVAMNNLIGQNQELYNQIEANQATLRASFSQDNPETPEDESDAMRAGVAKIDSRIKEATESVTEDLAKYYEISETQVEQLTLGDFLTYNGAEEALATLEADRQEAEARLNAERANLPDSVTGFFEIDNSSGTFNNIVLNIRANTSNITITGVSINGADAQNASLSKGINEVAFSYEIKGTPPVSRGGGDILVTIEQAGEVSTAAPQAGVQNQSNTGQSNGRVVVQLNSDPGQNPNPVTPDPDTSSSTSPSASNSPADPGAGSSQAPNTGSGNATADPALAGQVKTAQKMTFYVDADYSAYATQSYQDALANYHRLQGQVDYLDKPVATYLRAQVIGVLNRLNGDIELTTGDLLNQIAKVESEAETVGTNLDAILDEYRALNTRVADIGEAADSDRTSQGETTSALTALAPAFESLATASASARTASASNVTVAEGVRDNLANFEDTVARAESTTDELATDADSLSQSFSDELAKNQDYVSSFVKVLNNAYNNGVPNEVLLDFLSNPVREEAQATKATANVFKPFTWVLLIAMASLFIAYVFSNSRVFQTTLDKFTKDENFLLFADSKTIIVSQMLTMLIGLVIGVVSLNQLNISAAYSVIWVFSVLLMTMFLAQWIYLGLKYWKSIGMGLALFVLVSYIYLTSAVGTTATLSGFPLVLRNINILSIFESLLAGFFVKEPVALWQIFVLIVGLAIGITLGIFVKPKEVEEN